MKKVYFLLGVSALKVIFELSVVITVTRSLGGLNRLSLVYPQFPFTHLPGNFQTFLTKNDMFKKFMFSNARKF